MGMTIIEKILARASGAAKLAPGDLAVVDVDLSVLIDLSFSRGSWREVLKVHNPEKVVVVFDHDVPASNRETAAMHVRGLGAPDLLYAVTTGKTWFRIGETVRYDLEGRLGDGVSTKDVFLHIAGIY